MSGGKLIIIVLLNVVFVMHALNKTQEQWQNNLYGHVLMQSFQTNHRFHVMHLWYQWVTELYSCSLSTKYCSCAVESCFQAGNCCYDVLFRDSPLPPSDYMDNLIKIAAPYKNLSCLPITSNIPSDNNAQHIQQKRHCNQYHRENDSSSVGFNKTYESYVKLVQPVLGNDGIIYANSSVAECNGISGYNWINISANLCVLRYSVDSKSNDFTVKYTNCSYSLNSTVLSSKWKCDPYLNRADRLLDSKHEKFCTATEFALCRSYRAPVKDSNGICYQNPHCLLCLKGIDTYGGEPCPNATSATKTNVTGSGISLLFQFINNKFNLIEVCPACEQSAYLTKVQNKWHTGLYKHVFRDAWAAMKMKMSCFSKERDPGCSCDTLVCFEIGKCCIDVVFKKHMSASPRKYLAMFMKYMKEYQNLTFTCAPIFPRVQSNKDSVEKVLQRTSCIGSIEEDCAKAKPARIKRWVAHKIKTDIEALLPVIGSDDLIYINKYCAQCNGIHHYKWLKSKAVHCVPRNSQHNSSLIITEKYEKCVYRIYSNSRASRLRCKKYLERADSLIHNPEKRKCNAYEFALCRSYQAAVIETHTKIIYQNPHCLKCIGSSSEFIMDTQGTKIQTSKFQIPHLTSNKYDTKYYYSIMIGDGKPTLKDFCSPAIVGTNLSETQLQWHSDLFKYILENGNGHTTQQCELKRSYSCVYKRKHNDLCCSCDIHTCKKDCCIDAFFQSDPMPTMQYLRMFLKRTQDSKDLKCLPIISKVGEYDALYQINSCKASSERNINDIKVNETTQNYCEVATKHKTNIKKILPVLGSDNLVYRNQFCAECNNIYKYQWLNMTAKGCGFKRSQSMTLLEHYTNCDYRIGSNTIPEVLRCSLKTRYPKEIYGRGTCSEYEWALCKSYQANVYTKFRERVYKNLHCLKCAEGFTDFHVDKCKLDLGEPVSNIGYSLIINFLGNDMQIKVKESGDFVQLEDVHQSANQVPFNFTSQIVNVTSKKAKIDNTTQSLTHSFVNQIWSVKRLIGKVGGSLSIATLSITIITYALFKTLRNQPGKILMSLSITIVLSDIINVTMEYASQTQATCKAAAILLHWSLLAQHTWSSTIIYDMYRTFSADVRPTPMSLWKCSVVAWSVPTLIVFNCYILESVDSRFVGYGQSRDGCWIVSLITQILSYSVPFAISQIANGFMFVKYMRHIRKQQRVASSISGFSTGRDMQTSKLFLKVAMLLGLIEIFGVIQIPPYNKAATIANEIFSIAYTLTRSLRGFMIFFCFTAKRKVINLYMAKCNPHGNNARQASVTRNTSLSS